MWKAALAGAVALATVSSLTVSHKGVEISSAAAQEIVVNEGQIARLKEALQLTRAQLIHWRPVESTLRLIAQHQNYRLASADEGTAVRMNGRPMRYVLDMMAMQRLRSAAYPLVSILSEQQKQNGIAVLHSMGITF